MRLAHYIVVALAMACCPKVGAAADYITVPIDVDVVRLTVTVNGIEFTDVGSTSASISTTVTVPGDCMVTLDALVSLTEGTIDSDLRAETDSCSASVVAQAAFDGLRFETPAFGSALVAVVAIPTTIARTTNAVGWHGLLMQTVVAEGLSSTQILLDRGLEISQGFGVHPLTTWLSKVELPSGETFRVASVGIDPYLDASLSASPAIPGRAQSSIRLATTGPTLGNGDMNGDFSVDVADVVILRRLLAGLPVE